MLDSANPKQLCSFCLQATSELVFLNVIFKLVCEFYCKGKAASRPGSRNSVDKASLIPANRQVCVRIRQDGSSGQ